MLSPGSAAVLSLTVQNAWRGEVEAALQQLSVGVGERGSGLGSEARGVGRGAAAGRRVPASV